jgi:lysophospholipase L1-like esterase
MNESTVIKPEIDDRADLVIVAFGDSTTAPRSSVVTYSDLLESHFTEHGIGNKIINAGVPGDTTAHATKRFSRDVLSHHPDLVIVQFGVNDAAVDVWRQPPARRTRISLLSYKQNLRVFVKGLKSVGAEVVFMTPNPLTWTDYMKKRYGRFPYDPAHEDGFNVVLKNYAEAVRELVAEEGVGLVDVYSAFNDRTKTFGLKADQFLLDGMHPNNTGHALIARLLINHLSELPQVGSLWWPRSQSSLNKNCDGELHAS